MKYLQYISLLLVSLMLSQCDIKNSDIENDQSFIRIFHDNDLNNDYHPLDVVELDDGYLILSTKIRDSITYTYEYHIPYVVKTDMEGNVEWTAEGAYPYISPIPDLLEVNGNYYFFALHETSLGPTLFNINLSSQEIELNTGGEFGSNTYALKSIVDSEGNVLLLTNNNNGTRDAELLKISGIGGTVQVSSLANMTNSSNHGINVIVPTILEHLGHYNKQYPFAIQEYKNNNNLSSYNVNCFGNDLFSLYNIEKNGSSQSKWITGSRNKVFVASFQQLNDTLVGFVKNDNNKISIKSDLTLNNDNRYDIDDLSETTDFIELDGNSLIPSKIVTYNDVEYLLFAVATKGEQVAIFIYNTDDYTLHNIYYLGSTNDIEPVSIKQTKDDGLLVLCKTLVTNKYPRIALYKIPLKEIGI